MRFDSTFEFHHPAFQFGRRVPFLDQGRWEVLSSDGVTKYEVRLHASGSWSCDCPGFYYRQHCRHVGKIQEELRGDSKQVLRA